MLLLEQAERQHWAEYQAAQVARALGADVDPPQWWERREAFDKALAAPVLTTDAADPETAALRAALGLGARR